MLHGLFCNTFLFQTLNQWWIPSLGLKPKVITDACLVKVATKKHLAKTLDKTIALRENYI